jgi:hypothetical protein
MVPKTERLKADRGAVRKLIAALRGSCKGPDSLVEARERGHRQDERARSRKLKPEIDR